MKKQSKITVGIMDRQTEVLGCLDGNFRGDGFGPVSGWFSAKGTAGMIVLFDETHREITRSPSIRFTAQKDSTLRLRQGTKVRSGQAFTLFNVTIGNRFHWERTENQTFQGNLLLCLREDETIAAINEIPLEDYLKSVISSEMSAEAPMEFLKAHAILSRSWLLAGLGRRKKTKKTSIPAGKEKLLAHRAELPSNVSPIYTVPLDPAKTGLSGCLPATEKEGEVIRWYDREDHDLFDVCSDDHCQRYQGITKIVSKQAEDAVRETRGMVITYQDEICDARYSKSCGGITEDFGTAWDDKRIPYLISISDASVPHRPIGTEEEASRWIFSAPEAYCHTKDEALLEKILPDFDRETKGFFRWKVEYSRTELEEILREKSGFDFGTLHEIVPLHRGPSGRISRLKIVGSKRNAVVGKELEIRRWLSRSHLYSSAFLVTVKQHLHGEAERFTLHGAGWGHGVGLCQIGAAVMATRGFSTEEILRHYFRGTEIKKIY
ncbi:MAG: amidase [Deltaproteobacteria bacterium CG_4_8_14_3_um_filter_45_9]|nr:MAG: amidase [Deltaproteobacteria bacterium CG03_land_8_20_14_0_80_45_14]PIX24519.1 MAG: amidase [Deltaproteobacteria bacterium CG_4_8_14_3_um_filter_45_9]